MSSHHEKFSEFLQCIKTSGFLHPTDMSEKRVTHLQFLCIFLPLLLCLKLPCVAVQVVVVVVAGVGRVPLHLCLTTISFFLLKQPAPLGTPTLPSFPACCVNSTHTYIYIYRLGRQHQGKYDLKSRSAQAFQY